MFLDGAVEIARYDQQRYPFFETLTKKQLSFYWSEEEVDLSKDQKDFRTLDKAGEHVFTSNLKRQIVLDTEQGRSPSTVLLPIASLPEVENWIQTWSFFETIHSRSYSHIIRNVYADPSAVFDGISNITEIAVLGNSINEHYAKLDVLNKTKKSVDDEYKKALWYCLNSVNILEGIRFYVSFACSWAFAEQAKLMEGNAKIIQLIARDENLHLAGTQKMIKLLVEEDPFYAELEKTTREERTSLFEEAANQEKAWAEYLFSEGSMVGLNREMLCQYVEWITNKRMSSLGLKTIYKKQDNPLPWTQRWISGSDTQVAPQETEITSYTIGGMDMAVNPDLLKSQFNL